ncbi:MAG: N-6 DNA methylase, partial [Proteobacteria bacterium]|nr:N-6 DNA methylase [Pseudomonadota bacterium]
DDLSIGNSIPFYSDLAVPHWRNLIEQIHEFDFSKLDYEVIGNIFERLNSPEERHKYGQFYTRVEVVDLINSFCITRGDEKLMDPACGGGTFLVRAYARKRQLAKSRDHAERLKDLFGIDVSGNAAHLTTINLATRDLIDEENYPQIARRNFFDIIPQQTYLELPTHPTGKVVAAGMGEIQSREVSIPPLDAVVGNPPYIRQEDIPQSKKDSQGHYRKGTKGFYQDLVDKEWGLALSGRSDIHCYFWLHAAKFLKDDGWLCFLTPSQWLDVEYGFRLQEWILRHFELMAVFESVDEPWFEGARVATTVTILKRQTDEKKRMENQVRFVQLRRSMAEVLAHDGTMRGVVRVTDAFRDEILKLKENTVNQRYRARVVRQGALWTEGVRLGRIMGRRDDAENYYGGKWGVYLRAPDLWFDLRDEVGGRMAALGEIADVWRGITTGKDNFFFPRDCSDACLARYPDPVDFELNYGVPREKVAKGQVKLVRCGDKYGQVKPIESKYLEPEVHSLMDVDGFTVSPANCARQILLVGKKKSMLKDKYVKEYIKWGEAQGWHEGSTCSARATKDRGWYDLTGHKRGALFWPMAQQYKHCVPVNENNLICNHNLFDINAESDGIDVFGGILNSSWVVLSKFQYGRPVGVEGNLKTEVIDVNMMPVPDPTKGTARTRDRVAQAFRQLKKRKALQFLSERRMRQMAYNQAGKKHDLEKLSDQSELDMPDRRALDDAVLEMMGVRSKKRRQELIDRLYDYLREFFELTRQKEERAIANKRKYQSRGKIRPNEIAAQIHKDIAEKEPELLKKYDPDFIDKDKPFDTYPLPSEGTPEQAHTLLLSFDVAFKNGKKVIDRVPTKNSGQMALVVLVGDAGLRGRVRIPRDEQECQRVHANFQAFLRERETRVWELINQRTADAELQEKIHQALRPMLI